MMYVELMKNFLFADSREVKAVKLISAFWAKKTFVSYFLDMMYVELMKNFFSLIRASCLLLDSCWPIEPKNAWFLLSRHDVRRIHEKLSSRRFERAERC